MKHKALNLKQIFFKNLAPIIIMITSLIGLLSSMLLAVETIEFIRNPNVILNCSINPIINCSSVMETPQGQVLGFMNPLIGIVGFSMLFVFGLALFYKAKFPKLILYGAQAAATMAVLFVHWLIYSSIFVIGSLCPYCMVVWVVTIAIFVYITLYSYQNKILPKQLMPVGDFISKNHAYILIIWYALIIAIIVNHFGIASLTA